MRRTPFLPDQPIISSQGVFSPDTPTTHVLSNGVTVWLLQREDLPLISARFLFYGGSASDPREAYGLSTLTDEVMLHGAGGRDASAFAAFAEQQAIDIGIATSASSSVLYADMHASKLDSALDLLADAALRPELGAADMQRVRALMLGDIQQYLDDPGTVASWASSRLYYGAQHPYAHPEIGTKAGLKVASTARMRASWRARFTARRAHFIIVGAIDPVTLLPALEARFGELPLGTTPSAIPKPAGVPGGGGPRLVFVDKPGASQSILEATLPGWSAHDSQQLAGKLAVTALGGTFTSRLNSLMREEKGYTYGASALTSSGAWFGTVAASAAVQKDATAAALCDMLSVMRGQGGKFSEDELQKARAAHRTGILSSMESRARTAGVLVRLSRLRHRPDALAEELRAAQDCTTAQLDAAWSTRSALAGALVLVLGDLRAIRAEVEAALPGQWTVLDSLLR